MTTDTNDIDIFGCPFCYGNAEAPIVAELETVYAIEDGHPVTDRHTLIIPKRHVPNLFDLTGEERRQVHRLMHRRYHTLQKEDPTITGYNMGVNCGKSAGQTIFHLHVHLIPRRDGDTENPRGGVRGVIPGRRDYK